MANKYNYDYERGRYGRGYYEEPYYRGAGDSGESNYGGYGYSGYGQGNYYGGYYNEPDRSRYISSSGEPYGSYDYGRYNSGQYDYGERFREPYSQRGEENRYRESYNRNQYGRGEDRGLLERAGDEVRSWLGDEEAERRRRRDHERAESHAGRGPRGYRRSDERIREDVNDRLTEDWRIDASDIEVSVSNAVVTLTGRVESRIDKRRAEDLAEEVRGVTDVINQLRVGQSIESTTANQTTGTAGTTAARGKTAGS